MANLSSSGAMIVFQGDLAEGDEVMLQLLDQGSVAAQVRWVLDGRVGVSFADPNGLPMDE
ncbi:MAG: PilZ domain-containing protein [Sphingomonas bacterium]|nr:PilZ domain-containing protein [Sphingomonas bacterium]